MQYSTCGLVEVLSPQITKIGSANRKSAKLHLQRSANIANYLSSQVCGFAELIFGPPFMNAIAYIQQLASITQGFHFIFSFTTFLYFCPKNIAPSQL